MDKKLITALSVLASLLVLYFLNQYNQNQYSSNTNVLVDVIKEDIVISSGKAESKKKAEQLASKNTLIHYGVLN